MSKIAGTDFAKKSIKEVEDNNRAVRAQATPEQRLVMDEVQAAIDHENQVMDHGFAAEDRLRAWAKDLTGMTMHISAIETLRDALKQVPPGGLHIVNDEVVLIKSQLGTIDRVDRYINTIEKSLINLTNNSQFTPLSFGGLIKLAFKKLFTKGTKRG